MNFPPTPDEQRMLDMLAGLVLSEDPSAKDDAYAQMAVEYAHFINESSAARCPQNFGSSESFTIEGQHRQSLGSPALRGSMGSLRHDSHSSRISFDQRTPELNDSTCQSYRRQSLELTSDRRASLATEVDNHMRRSSLPNPTLKDLKPPKRRVVGNGVYKFETLPWHESSLRQAMARRAHEKKEQLASPLPLINLRPEAEARLRDVLGEEGYAEWRRKHRVSYLLNEG
ncbi:hypothetical protein BDM02DRAFT_3126069 [Thelephora ganbajun]|uniref:Uncharacterized protein n=1 Tax=Thelephora ganbajun TaxID=370292 RepID=A0ACB6ZU41_THEGA|nr:hypothetical protein BDM02DRAFT_3126069 [Thelephora ganbajun]